MASQGELFNYVYDRQGLPAPVARLFFQQLMSAVHYIHEKGVAHRDVKLENMLLDENLDLKLADFGMSKIFAGENSSVLETQCGSELYMGPELLMDEPQVYEGPPVDIFACGVAMYIINVGNFPWSKAGDDHYTLCHSDLASYKSAMEEASEVRLDDDMLDLFVQMTDPVPAKRTTMPLIAQHKWL